jgi:hypothetical protein
MKLHAQIMYICVLYVFAQNWWYEMLLLMNYDEFMIGCCCCCCEMLLLIIETLGNHNLWACYEFVLFLKVFMKMGQMMNFVGRMFWCKLYMILSVFSCLETFKQTLGSNLSLGKSKLGFWGENGVFPVTELSQLATATWRRVVRRARRAPCDSLASRVNRSRWRAAQWQHPLFHVLVSFSLVLILIWLLV